MNRRVTAGLFMGIVSLLVAAVSPETTPLDRYVVVTSDTHLSTPEGRFRDQAPKVERFLNALELSPTPPDAVFIVGDIVDNTVKRDGHLQPGNRMHFQAEADLYARIKQQHPRIAVMQSLGPGHDFGGPISLADAESALGPKAGVWRWEGITFIWLTIPRSAFAPSISYENSLSTAEYQWLDDRLAEAQRSILLFHVPLRNDATFTLGKWPGGLNLTIDSRDRIGEVIRRHKTTIAAIFCGHIHQRLATEWNSIPLYLAPFITGDFATVHWRPVDGSVEVRLHRLEPDGRLKPD